MSSTANLLTMPPEMVLEIFLNMSAEEILQRCRTSTFFNSICNDPHFWKLYAREHGIPLTESTWKASVIDAYKYEQTTLNDISLYHIEHVTGNKLPSKFLYKIQDDDLTFVWNVGNVFTEKQKQELEKHNGSMFSSINNINFGEEAYGLTYERQVHVTSEGKLTIECFFFRTKTFYKPKYSINHFLRKTKITRLFDQIVVNDSMKPIFRIY